MPRSFFYFEGMNIRDLMIYLVTDIFVHPLYMHDSMSHVTDGKMLLAPMYSGIFYWMVKSSKTSKRMIV